jgi:hypothetical protein
VWEGISSLTVPYFLWEEEKQSASLTHIFPHSHPPPSPRSTPPLPWVIPPPPPPPVAIQKHCAVAYQPAGLSPFRLEVTDTTSTQLPCLSVSTHLCYLGLCFLSTMCLLRCTFSDVHGTVYTVKRAYWFSRLQQRCH